jgi:hypothetical protein
MILLRNNRRPQADFPKSAPTATEKLATARCATRPGARQHPLQMQKLATEKFHSFTSSVHAMANDITSHLASVLTLTPIRR